MLFIIIIEKVCLISYLISNNIKLCRFQFYVEYWRFYIERLRVVLIVMPRIHWRHLMSVKYIVMVLKKIKLIISKSEAEVVFFKWFEISMHSFLRYDGWVWSFWVLYFTLNKWSLRIRSESEASRSEHFSDVLYRTRKKVKKTLTTILNSKNWLLYAPVFFKDSFDSTEPVQINISSSAPAYTAPTNALYKTNTAWNDATNLRIYAGSYGSIW